MVLALAVGEQGARRPAVAALRRQDLSLRCAKRPRPTLPSASPAAGLLAGAQELPPDLCFNQLQVSAAACSAAARGGLPSCRW